jgi:CBS domain containing-hemolysin-like protein
MTPRPEIYAVDGSMTLEVFTAALEENIYSRVPVFSGQLDNITGIVFAHDLLQVLDTEASQLTVAQLQKPAAFVPETKKVNELLREMQRQKQHMRIVIDEYGGVAGLITIEDLIEAIVGNIADEHDETEDDDAPIAEPDGSFIVSGSFEISRLRDLFQSQFDARFADKEDSSDATEAIEPSATPALVARVPADRRSPVSGAALTSAERRSLADRRASASDLQADTDSDSEDPNAREEVIVRELTRDSDQPTALRLPEHYESTTLGGLVSEIAGHIPLPGEVVEEDGLRLEVLASTDRRIDRIRVGLSSPSATD